MREFFFCVCLCVCVHQVQKTDIPLLVLLLVLPLSISLLNTRTSQESVKVLDFAELSLVPHPEEWFGEFQSTLEDGNDETKGGKDGQEDPAQTGQNGGQTGLGQGRCEDADLATHQGKGQEPNGVNHHRHGQQENPHHQTDGCQENKAKPQRHEGPKLFAFPCPGAAVDGLNACRNGLFARWWWWWYRKSLGIGSWSHRSNICSCRSRCTTTQQQHQWQRILFLVLVLVVVVVDANVGYRLDVTLGSTKR